MVFSNFNLQGDESSSQEQEYPHLFQYVFVMGLVEGILSCDLLSCDFILDPSTKKLKTQITYQYPPPVS